MWSRRAHRSAGMRSQRWWHRDAGAEMQAKGCRCRDAPSKGSKVKIKCLELASSRGQEGAGGWREPLDEGGVFSTGAMSSQQPQGLGGIFPSASQAMNVGLIRGGF